MVLFWAQGAGPFFFSFLGSLLTDVSDKRAANAAAFLAKAKEAHKDFDFDYSGVEYVNSLTKVRIFCNTHKQDFFPLPQDFVKGKSRCPKCGEAVRLSKRILPFSDWLPRAREVHGDRYEYDPKSWVSLHNPVRIKCPDHGWFEQEASNHTSGKSGCPKCGRDSGAVNRRLSPEELLSRAKIAHGDTYTYPDIEGRIGKFIDVCCPKHGVFQQRFQSHVNAGHGCPTCATGRISTGQQEIYDFLTQNTPAKTLLEQSIFGRKSVDIYLPDHKIAIEYNGLYYHSEPSLLSDIKPIGQRDALYHLKKTRAAEELGVDLLHIWEDEWLTNQKIVERILLQRLGLLDEPRELTSAEVSFVEATEYIEANSLGGLPHKSCRCFAMKSPDGEVCSMIALSQGGSTLTIDRYVTSKRTPGALKAFLEEFKQRTPGIKNVIAWTDRRIDSGHALLEAGFSKVEELPPGYFYINARTRLPSRMFDKERLQDLIGTVNPKLSVRDNCEVAGWSRLWDCGRVKWSLDL